MKRTLKHGAVVLGLLILALVAIAAFTFGGMQSAPPSLTLNGVQIVLDGSAIAVVPTAENQVLLVDSGMDPKATNLQAELSKRGMTEESVTAILFTHGHFDHLGGAKLFPNAQLMALGAEAPLISGSVGSRGLVTRFFSVSPTGLKLSRELEDGETLTIGTAQVKVFAIPGHTMGSAAYLINGILFMGDSAVSTTTGKLEHSVWIFSDDIQANNTSLRSLEKRLRDGGEPVQAIAFGHSAVLEQGLKPLSDWVKANAD